MFYVIVVEEKIDRADEKTEIRWNIQYSVDNCGKSMRDISERGNVDWCPSTNIDDDDENHMFEKTCITMAKSTSMTFWLDACCRFVNICEQDTIEDNSENSGYDDYDEYLVQLIFPWNTKLITCLK